MKRICALFLLMMTAASNAVYAAPATGEAAGSAATTFADGNSNAMGIGAVLGIALATMGSRSDSSEGSTTATTSTTTSPLHWLHNKPVLTSQAPKRINSPGHP
ncbi:hypothetical protein LU631_24515 [Erwinia tracheiphila]|uniref:exopolysaccharide production protein YjbE n=1 Tax=Erwinia tracheiphila TaxID=65700 RepID=UPI00039A6B59|nr:exopolysaccharide production protein YjbE [Erwinia tracheiphila]UIA87773.1 hypothetical protein LU631_24515 [Erwinia tracheiphila]UIA96138.1 hypothetical protein LU633_22955 [Erwinia tracheiphila]